jgi:hypothetical protein
MLLLLHVRQVNMILRRFVLRNRTVLQDRNVTRSVLLNISSNVVQTLDRQYQVRRLLWLISKKHFRLGELAASEWTRSVRAVRDTPVADYSAPGVNTTRRVAYRPPIAVSPFLLALSVSYFKQTLWRCGQL